MSGDSGVSWSVRDRAQARWRIAVLESQLMEKWRTPDASAEQFEALRVATDPIRREIEGLQRHLRSQTFPEGDWSCLVHDDPVFGAYNPPSSDALLYHYTRVETLFKIRERLAWRFGPLSAMNDPQEALDTEAFMTGLMGPPGQPLQLTTDEADLAHARDWVAEISAHRGRIKVGAFVTDTRPPLVDVPLETADHVVPRRVAAHRGYCHPRMWAQYADNGKGVCVVLDHELLRQSVAESVDGKCPWGYGPVTYEQAEHAFSLGFFDYRDLLTDGGVASALLRNFEQSLLTKHGDWQHEAEFRFFVVDGTDDPWMVPLLPGTVVGLVLGPSFREEDRQHVLPFASAFGIEGRLRYLTWRSGEPELFW